MLETPALYSKALPITETGSMMPESIKSSNYNVLLLKPILALSNFMHSSITFMALPLSPVAL